MATSTMQVRALGCVAALLAVTLGGCGQPASRAFIRAVGSSTVYPFATAVSENFARSGQKSPVIEATGTGAGMRLFCAGVGAAHPDVEDASRRMKPGEYAKCQANGVTRIVEIQVGIDGIAFAEAKRGPRLALTPLDLYKAIAARPFGQTNTAKVWRDVNPALPAIPIMVYGPPSTSGTRDALSELILAAGCRTDPALGALEAKDPGRYKKLCLQIRDDGPYVDAGENDNLIVQKLTQNPTAIGVFGYSYLEKNADKITGIPISGVAPTYETISNFTYPGARPLYIYVKQQHLAAVRGLREYVGEWARAWGPNGYLKTRGMIISPADVRAKNAAIARDMTPLDPRQLQAFE